MPLTADDQLRIFGEPDWVEQMGEMGRTRLWGMRTFAIGILSDAQELLAMVADGRRQGTAVAETARQYINKAKYVMSTYLVTKPSEEENDALNIAIDHCATEDAKNKLRWLMDPRR
jgi:hypothetical protein